MAVEDGRAYAVGAAGTVLCDDGSGWDVVLADGPRAQSTPLAAVAATGTGGVWIAGDSGTVARLDTETGRNVSYAEPDGDTTNIVALGAAGADGTETVLLADGSGRLRRGRYSDGDVAWDRPITPGSGSSVSGVVLSTPSTGYVCDTNQAVFRTTDGGRTADRIGLDAAGTLTDLAVGGADGCLVSDDSGVISRYDGRRWTPERVTDGTVTAVAARKGLCLASGPAGTVFENEGAGWRRVVTPASSPLDAVALGAGRAVGVGADGTVVERTTSR